VWIAGDADRYYLFSAGDAGKVKRIRATRRIRLAACDVRGNLKSDWIEGEGRILDDPAAIDAALRALRRKYRFQMLFTDFFAKLSGRFRRRAYIEIALA
jgi:PPOX class probable F420-dependent enzyme